MAFFPDDDDHDDPHSEPDIRKAWWGDRVKMGRTRSLVRPRKWTMDKLDAARDKMGMVDPYMRGFEAWQTHPDAISFKGEHIKKNVRASTEYWFWRGWAAGQMYYRANLVESPHGD